LDQEVIRSPLIVLTYLRKLFSSSYVVKINMHRHSYVVYVAFEEKEERSLNIIQPSPLSLKSYVNYVTSLIDIDFLYVNHNVIGTYLRRYY